MRILGGLIAIIIILFGIAIALVVYNLNLRNKLETLSNTNQKVTSLSVLQDFMNTVSEQITAEEKIKKINEILIEKYEIKYSTIVIYNGAEYEIKASNVEEKHWDTLKNLQSEKVFIDSIQTATTKYITVSEENDKLYSEYNPEYVQKNGQLFNSTAELGDKKLEQKIKARYHFSIPLNFSLFDIRFFVPDKAAFEFVSDAYLRYAR